MLRPPTYDLIGYSYSAGRRPDPRIAAQIEDALGNAETVLNIGAKTGSYEPADREVTAIEPSGVMVAQRPPGSAPVVQATPNSCRSKMTASTWRWQSSVTTTGTTEPPAYARWAGSPATASSSSTPTQASLKAFG